LTNWYHITTGQFGYPQPESNFGYIDKTYDTSNACLTCSIGLQQKDEFQFRSEPKAKHSQFIGLNWVFDQIFVRQIVKDIFEQEKITGLNFSQPVINKTGLSVEGIYQLRVDNLISSGLSTENLKTESCELPKDKGTLKFLKANNSKLAEGPFCGQTKYNFPQGDNNLKINSPAFEGQPDVVRLGYYFGSGGSANRPILVSERIKELIERERWRGAFLNQVELL
jgi:hypothetical protein